MSKKLLMNTNDSSLTDNFRKYYQEMTGSFITASDISVSNILDTERFIEIVEVFGNTIQDETDLSKIESLGVWNERRQGYEIDILSGKDYTSVTYDYLKNLNPANIQDWTAFALPKIPIGTIEIEVNNIVPRGVRIAIMQHDGTVFKLLSISDEGVHSVNIANDNTTYIAFHSGSIKGGNVGDLFTEQLGKIFNFTIKIPNAKQYIFGEQHKATILLPCQLQKVGDVADRLYWDGVKGRYIVEKLKLKEGSININTVNITYTEHSNYFVFRKPMDAYDYGVNNGNTYLESSFATVLGRIDTSLQRVGHYSIATYGVNDYAIMTDKSITTIDQINNLINTNNWKINYLLKQDTPQLIETSITEKIKVPTYANKTHISFVSENGIDCSDSKVLVPYKELL